MPWQSLGSLSPSGLQWQSFNAPAIESELFRFITHWNVRPSSYCSLAQYFPESGRGFFTRLYASVEPTILELKIPQNFKQNNLLVRDIQLKLHLPENVDTFWEVEAQIWY